MFLQAGCRRIYSDQLTIKKNIYRLSVPLNVPKLNWCSISPYKLSNVNGMVWLHMKNNINCSIKQIRIWTLLALTYKKDQILSTRNLANLILCLLAKCSILPELGAMACGNENPAPIIYVFKQYNGVAIIFFRSKCERAKYLTI